MDQESTGILFIPSSLGGEGVEESLRKAFEDKGVMAPIIVKGAVEDLKHAKLTEQLKKPVTPLECPYGPPGGLHSPVCFCALSPDKQEVILWNELSERF